MKTRDFEKTLKDVEKFVNKPGIEVMSIMNFIFGIIVWYKIWVFKTTSKRNP